MVKKENTIVVETCGLCPFQNIDWNPDAVGNDTIETCLLSKFLNKEEYFIDCYDSYSMERDNTVEVECDYCIQLESLPTETPFDKSKCSCHTVVTEEPEVVIPPNWCPLKNEDFKIKMEKTV